MGMHIAYILTLYNGLIACIWPVSPQTLALIAGGLLRVKQTRTLYRDGYQT